MTSKVREEHLDLEKTDLIYNWKTFLHLKISPLKSFKHLTNSSTSGPEEDKLKLWTTVGSFDSRGKKSFVIPLLAVTLIPWVKRKIS